MSLSEEFTYLRTPLKLLNLQISFQMHKGLMSKVFCQLLIFENASLDNFYRESNN